MIEVKEVSKSFGAQDVLKKISCLFEAGKPDYR